MKVGEHMHTQAEHLLLTMLSALAALQIIDRAQLDMDGHLESEIDMLCQVRHLPYCLLCAVPQSGC